MTALQTQELGKHKYCTIVLYHKGMLVNCLVECVHECTYTNDTLMENLKYVRSWKNTLPLLLSLFSTLVTVECIQPVLDSVYFGFHTIRRLQTISSRLQFVYEFKYISLFFTQLIFKYIQINILCIFV